MQDELFPLPKTFRITRGWRVFLLILPLISILWGIGAIWLMQLALNESNDRTYHMILALLSFGMALLFLWGSFDYSKSRLVFTSDGMTFYGSGFRVYTPWQNVVGIENMSGLIPMTIAWTSKLIGFRLRQNAAIRMTLAEGVRQGRAVIETDWWYPVSMRTPFADFFIIDEIIRERHWQQGALGAYLSHYAPQAFEGRDVIAQKERADR